MSFNIEKVPKLSLCILPTPIIPMKNLSESLAKRVEIYVKRDDLTGLAFGGNKCRKAEYLLANAKSQKADTIITEGAIQSNHCLQTAICSLKTGFNCELVLSGDKPQRSTGNFYLNNLLSIPIHIVETTDERKAMMEERRVILQSEGKHPYIIPTGGSTSIGIYGYINFIKEIADQSPNLSFDYLIIASGSGGTQAGSIIGKNLYLEDLEVIGISPGDQKWDLVRIIKKLITEFEEKESLNLDEAITLYDEYSGPGYGILNKETIDTIKLIATLEGLFLDPVYTGKAMVGMIDLINREIIPSGSRILFLHSGGGPSLFTDPSLLI
ncbi:MAG: D-cysteine desulfhydrase family protein [Candidatus Heimdallarchaeota archaeon]|nr:MAG: D-cysteine desulfhydrase family protein [Candidatus Heimdallarchaeota archaeon]